MANDMDRELFITQGYQKDSNQEFINSDDVEQYLLDEEYDDGEDRTGYFFGEQCPLPMWEKMIKTGSKCQVYKTKCYGCRSFIDIQFAQNYLAKHAFECGNHPTSGNKEEAWIAAHECVVETFVETAQDRKWYAESVANAKKTSNKKRETCDWDSRDKRGGGRDSRDGGDRDSRDGCDRDKRGGKGGGHCRGDPRDGPRPPTHAPASASRMRPISPEPHVVRRRSRSRERGGHEEHRITMVADRMARSAQQAADLNSSELQLVPFGSDRNKSAGVRVKVPELEALHACLSRSEHSQVKLCEQLTFFARQFEDERKITKEAKDAVSVLINKGKLQAACTHAAESSYNRK